MVQTKTPHPTLPPTYVPPGGMAYRVKDNDNWGTVAAKLGIDAKLLIHYNFNTNIPEEVNYYLEHNVGCTQVSPDGKNYSFRGASPGIIYHPLIPPVTSFYRENVSDLKMREDSPGHWDLRAHFCLAFLLNNKLADASPYCYRQYIKGRARIRLHGDIWRDKPDMYRIPSGHATGPLPRSTYAEDGRRDQWGNILRYGYREVQPYAQNKEIDEYLPPRYPQDGYQYLMSDTPGASGQVTGYTPSGERVDIEGISLDLHFRGDVVEFRNLAPVRVWARQYWSYEAHFEITSTNPFRFKAISPPD